MVNDFAELGTAPGGPPTIVERLPTVEAAEGERHPSGDDHKEATGHGGHINRRGTAAHSTERSTYRPSRMPCGSRWASEFAGGVRFYLRTARQQLRDPRVRFDVGDARHLSAASG